MTTVRHAFLEMIILTVASVGVALATNALRERKSIDLTKNYFETKTATPQPEAGRGKSAPQQPGGAKNSSEKPAQNAPALPSATPPAKEDAPAKGHLDHDFQTITLEDVQTVLADPQTAQGLNVLVDARDDEHFAAGHLPSAMQCFPYELHRCINQVLARANGAAKVIVYCEGGDCEDSIFMCRELIDAGVPYEIVYLFEGGWKQWSSQARESQGETQE